MKNLRFFIDFDGTITKNDVVDMILERFGLSQWTEVERQWMEGQIGSRECLSKQMDLVSATEQEFTELISQVEIDPFFINFLERAQNLSIPVAIVSDGFDIVIDQIFKQSFLKSPELFQHLPVYSNKLKRTPRGYKALFTDEDLCAHACANCKPRVMKKIASEGETIVFVGDGFSDRFAAQESQLTFAKGKLLKFCEENKIKHIKYSSFKEIDEWLAKTRKGDHVYV